MGTLPESKERSRPYQARGCRHVCLATLLLGFSLWGAVPIARANAGHDLFNLCYSFLQPQCLDLAVDADLLECLPDGVTFKYNVPRYVIEVVNRDGDMLLGEPFSFLGGKVLNYVGPALKYAVAPILGAAIGATLMEDRASGAALGAAVGSIAMDLKALEASSEEMKQGQLHVRKQVHVFKIVWDPWSMLKIDASCTPAMVPDYPLIYPVYFSEGDFIHWNSGIMDLFEFEDVSIGGKGLKAPVPRVLKAPFETIGPYGPAYPTWGKVSGGGNSGQAEVVLALRGLQRAQDLGVDPDAISMTDVRRVMVTPPGKFLSGPCVNPNMPLKDYPAHIADFSFTSIRSPRGLIVIVYKRKARCIDKETYLCGLKVITEAVTTAVGCAGCAAAIESGVQGVNAAYKAKKVKEFYDKARAVYREYKSYINMALKAISYGWAAYELVDTYEDLRKQMRAENPELSPEAKKLQETARNSDVGEDCKGLVGEKRKECLISAVARETCVKKDHPNDAGCVEAERARLSYSDPAASVTGERGAVTLVTDGESRRFEIPTEGKVSWRWREGSVSERDDACLPAEAVDALKESGSQASLRICPGVESRP